MWVVKNNLFFPVEAPKAIKTIKTPQLKKLGYESELLVSTVSVGNDSDDDVPLYTLKSTLARQKKEKGERAKRKYNGK